MQKLAKGADACILILSLFSNRLLWHCCFWWQHGPLSYRKAAQD